MTDIYQERAEARAAVEAAYEALAAAIRTNSDEAEIDARVILARAHKALADTYRY